jgi:hypothetical protein
MLHGKDCGDKANPSSAFAAESTILQVHVFIFHTLRSDLRN